MPQYRFQLRLTIPTTLSSPRTETSGRRNSVDLAMHPTTVPSVDDTPNAYPRRGDRPDDARPGERENLDAVEDRGCQHHRHRRAPEPNDRRRVGEISRRPDRPAGEHVGHAETIDPVPAYKVKVGSLVAFSVLDVILKYRV